MASLALLKAAAVIADTEARLAYKRYHAALIEAFGIKVDDVIDFKTYPDDDWAPAIVRDVRVKHGKVEVMVAPKTKAGWHKSTRIPRIIRVNGEERRIW